MLNPRLQEIDKFLVEEGCIPKISRTYKALQQFISNDKDASTLKERITLLAPSDLPILIIGESGTGKELIARALHGDNRQGDFISVNCGSVPETLIESEFFGSVQGAYTGARDREGFFELANNGTIFLDEIGEMPHQLQCKLLRALQEKQFYKVGGRSPVRINCRVVSATNNNNIIDRKIFREDLYYRLAGSVIHLKPLREKANDIPLICLNELFNNQSYVDTFLAEQPKEYTWPGNVRELLNKLNEFKVLRRIIK